MVLASQVWHFWIAVAITVPSVILVVATIIGYLMKVSKTRYPNR